MGKIEDIFYVSRKNWILLRVNKDINITIHYLVHLETKRVWRGRIHKKAAYTKVNEDQLKNS